MDTPRQGAAYAHPIRLADLRGEGVREVTLEPDAEARAAIAGELGLLGLKKLRLEARLIPEGRADWRLEGRLGATVIQPCVATLAPVTTRIETEFVRRYLAEMPDLPEGEEIEMPDENVEPLPAVLDLGAVLVEELELNLPLYPRAKGVADTDLAAAPPGVAPLTEAEVKPFAGLKALKDRMEGGKG